MPPAADRIGSGLGWADGGGRRPRQLHPASVSNMTTQPRRVARPVSAGASARAVACEVRTLPGET